jgi:hypothetical protein
VRGGQNPLVAGLDSINKTGVIAGLDPAIQLFAKRMDPRVKPAGDASFLLGFSNL